MGKPTVIKIPNPITPHQYIAYKLENNYITESSTSSQVPQPGIQNWEDEPLEYLALKANGAWRQEPHKIRGNRDFTLKGAHKEISHARWPRAKAVIW